MNKTAEQRKGFPRGATSTLARMTLGHTPNKRCLEHVGTAFRREDPRLAVVEFLFSSFVSFSFLSLITKSPSVAAME